MVHLLTNNKCFNGFQQVYEHLSNLLKCNMKFSLYVPPQVKNGTKVPVLYWLSGLTCTEQNFIIKSGFQKYAAKHGLCVVGPDTSPRNVNIECKEDLYTLGYGAGFYVDATTEKWKPNFQMFSYVTDELIKVVESNFSFVKPGVRSIAGHSMGGHGALICAMKNPGMYVTATAFAPLSDVINSEFSQTAFSEYLGPDKSKWAEYDSVSLISKYKGPPLHFRVDQGSVDEYLEKHLLTHKLVEAAKKANIPLEYHLHDEYDHSYYFVSSFIEQQFEHHAKYLFN